MSKNKHFVCTQCGECCGPIPLFKTQLEKIKLTVRNMSQDERERLKNQNREELTCILLDTETKRCSVYHARPLVCQQYGKIRELRCPSNKGIELKSGRKETAKSLVGESLAGILSEDIGWRELEEIK